MNKNRYHKWRESTQISTIIFFILVPLLNRYSIHWITGTLYSVSIGRLEIMDPSLAIQKLFLVKHLALTEILGAGIVVLIAVFMGRVFCGWICPYHFLMEMLFKIFPKSGSMKMKTDFTNPSRLKFFRVPLILLLVAAITGVPIFTMISFPGILTGIMADLLFWGSIGIGVGLILLVATYEFVTRRRFWCKYVCPVGASLGMCGINPSLKIRFVETDCSCNTKLSPCNSVCPIQLNPKSKNLYPACFNCGECITVCDHFGGALEWSYSVKVKNAKTFLNEA